MVHDTGIEPVQLRGVDPLPSHLAHRACVPPTRFERAAVTLKESHSTIELRGPECCEKELNLRLRYHQYRVLPLNYRSVVNLRRFDRPTSTVSWSRSPD